MAKKKKKTSDEFEVFSSHPHQNYNGSVSFGTVVLTAVYEVRQSIAIMNERSNADEYAPGAIHALRKLCEGEKEKPTICVPPIAATPHADNGRMLI